MRKAWQQALDDGMRTRRALNVVVLAEAFFGIVAVFCLLTLLGGPSAEALADPRKEQLLWMTWLARQHVAVFLKVGLGCLGVALSLELVRRWLER